MRVKPKAKQASRPSANGTSLANVFATNMLLERQLWLRKLLDPRRDIEIECGHPPTITKEDYRHLFERGDIAARVVSVWPEESWSENPEIMETEDETETEFEATWTELQEQLNIYPMLERADILSGVGTFGVLLLGLDDGLNLDQPAPGINERGEAVGRSGGERQLLYLRAFDESYLQVNRLEGDVSNPRYGLPLSYNIMFDTENVAKQTAVHWSRVIHLADNRTVSEIYGTPRMKRVFNRILDIRKIAGGSGEMFWKGGFPGISLESMPGVDEDVTFDAEATKAQMEAYMNGLQRYIATVGMQAKSLGVQVADPGPHLVVQLKLIATALGVPWRVLIGSEAAQLASEQDTRAWNRRLKHRRDTYLTPFLIRPFIDRLVAFGILPEPAEVIVSWPDLNAVSDADKAGISEKRSNAISKYVQSGSDALVPPFHYLTLVLGMKDDEARAMLEAAGLQEGDRLEVTESADGEPGDEGEEDDEGATPVRGRNNGQK